MIESRNQDIPQVSADGNMHLTIDFSVKEVYEGTGRLNMCATSRLFPISDFDLSQTLISFKKVI